MPISIGGLRKRAAAQVDRALRRAMLIKVDRALRRAMLTNSRLRRHFAIERRALDPPWPIFGSRTETSGDGILPNVIYLRRQLLAPFIVPEPVIKITILPSDGIVVPVEMFPIANDAAHRIVSRKGQQRMDVIGH